MTHQERLEDIAKRPEAHKHVFETLQICCMEDGALDLQLLDAHAAHVDMGSNGGVRCDVRSGPCACGAWH